MSDISISSLHILKLGHKIEEIRIRALNHIISKLDHVIIFSEVEFSRYLELLRKLFEWFDFEPHVEEEKVLKLLSRILKSETGEQIIKHTGTLPLLKDLKEIRLKINEKYHYLIDDLINLFEPTLQQNSPSDHPELQLISDIPLSYRSDQSEYINFSNSNCYSKEGDILRSAKSYNYTKNSKSVRDNVNDNKVESTATAISGLERKSSSVSGVRTCPPTDKSSSSSQLTSIRDILYQSVPYVTLNWQPLVKSDYQVFKSVEDSLQRPPEPQVLIHSCDFFCNVMLQDFPAEVFLQRPHILMLFYDMIQNSPSTRITNSALICLNKLSENLITRLRYYSDPCTYNQKPNTTNTAILTEPNIVTPNVTRTFNYNIDFSNVGAGDVEIEDLNNFEQITLPKYCVKTFLTVLAYIAEKPQSFKESQNKKKTQSGINVSLQIIDKLATLITLCIKPSIWSSQRDRTILEISENVTELLDKLGDVLEQYKLMVLATDMEYFERMAQLHLLHSTSYLLSELIPISQANSAIPRSLKSAISSSLLDSSFGKLYPNAHETLVLFVNEFKGQYETESLTKYKDLKIVCKAMSKAVKLLKNTDNYTIENLRTIKDSLPCFEFHKNLSIINTFLKICVRNNTLFNLDKSTSKTIEEILLTLLSHPDEDIQKETYSLCQKLIVNLLGINHTKHASESDPGSQVTFFFRPAFFVELAAHGLVNNSVQIQTQAEDMLLHILKCKFVVSENVWKKMIKSLMPAMPILQCFADTETPLGKSIVKILDPDISSTLFISEIDILKGNLRMLFSKNIVLRNEAVSRLCWLLTTAKDSDNKVPRIKSLDDCGLCNIFQIEYPIDLSRKRCTQQFYQVSSLQQVIDLLSTKNIEPSIRRSALTQISVMLEDPFMHSCFLEQNGLDLILSILDKSLFSNDYENYPDSVIPIMSILKNICLHNAVIRTELAMDLKLIFNILRGLLLYCTDKRIQNDGSLLCLLLLFNEFVVYSQSSNDSVGFSVPDILVQKLKIPVKCHTHWKTSRNTSPSLLGLLMSDDWCKSTLRMHWNIEWFGGVTELINWSKAQVLTRLTPDQLAEFSTDLRLTKIDLLALKASSVCYCCQRYLYDIENAVTHQNVVEAVRGISGYIGLWILANKNIPYEADDSLLKLNWNSAFIRFLSAPPANPEDENLLAEIIKCLITMLKLYKNSGDTCWIIDVLQDTSHYLPKLLKIDTKSDKDNVNLELLDLISSCSTLEQQLLDIGLITGSQQEVRDKNKNWVPIIQSITENLKHSDSEQFYSLAYLDKLLSCLVQITSNMGWSESCTTNQESHKIFSELIEALSELLTAFHYGKGNEAPSSFMGISITRNTILTMNHLLYEMQHTSKKNWETYWVSDTVCSSTIFSLCSLWSCRDVVVRAGTLLLLSGIASGPRGATVIVENVRQKHRGVWQTALSIMIDQSEASIVRENAAILLTNLCSHVKVSATGSANLPLCHAPLSSNKNAKPMDTVLTLLKEYNFFEELDILLACLHLETSFEPSLLSIPKPKSVEIAHNPSVVSTARSYVPTSTSSPTLTSNEINVFVTPSFVKAAANFVSNLLYLAPEAISENMAEFGLIKGFFRCLSAPQLDLTDSKCFLLYTDTLEMNSAVCNLLTRSILVNNTCRIMILHTRDCLHVLISLLNPNLYDIQQPHFLYLRNQLWCEIFRFLTALLDLSSNKSNPDLNKESYNVISSLLTECGHETFFKSVCESIESNSAGLQKSCLQSLTSLLTIETVLPAKKLESSTSFSLQNLLDFSKTPREISQENIENLPPRSESLEPQIQPRQSVLQNYKNNLENVPRKSTSRKKFSPRISEPDINVMIGADLCKILLKLYDLQSIDSCKDGKRKSIIVGALSSLLNTSEEAKKCALSEGLLSTVLNQLKGLHTELSLHSAESLRKINEKKKVCPILKEVDSLFCMITNFIVGNHDAKETASNLGLADLTHKFWVWFNFEQSMLINSLKLLCTYTTNCSKACQSLTLTNAMPGSGPRKMATNLSLLNAIIILVIKEMELVSRSHDIIVLQLCFHILKNVCSVSECRTILTKSNLFQGIHRLHPLITKRQRPWESVENLWLEFLEIFSFYSEGQLFLTKIPDILELILALANCPRNSNKLVALSVLRNLSFHHSNRTKLLGSVEFIELLHNKLTNGPIIEKNMIVTMIWALVANSQRSKIALKCAGFDTRLQEILKQYEMQGINDKSYQTMLYVLGVLKEGEK